MTAQEAKRILRAVYGPAMMLDAIAHAQCASHRANPRDVATGLQHRTGMSPLHCTMTVRVFGPFTPDQW